MIKKLFTDHPHATGETYFQHMWFALYLSFQGFRMFLAAFIHAIFPFMFQKTTTNILVATQHQVQKRFKKADKKLEKIG